MRLLLDTQSLLWWLEGSDRLKRHTKAILDDPATQIYVSSVAAWEVSIKAALGKLDLEINLEERVANLIDNGAQPLHVTFRHAYAVRHLPLHHRDPFDRLLVAQAKCEA